MSRRARTRATWAAGVRAPATVLGLIGIALWLLGTYQVGEQARTEDQFAPLNLAVFGLIVAGTGPALVFVRGRQVVGARGRVVDERVRVLSRFLAGETEPEDRPNDPAGFLGGDGTSFFHRPECPMGAGRAWTVQPRDEHEAEGRRPCGLCRP